MKKFLLIFLAGTMVLGLVACAASNQPPSSNPQPDTDDTQTVQIGAYEVTLEGENGEIHLAKWTYGGYTYAVMPDVPMTAAAMTELISQVK